MWRKRDIFLGLLLACALALLILFSQEKTDVFIYSNF